MNMQNEIFEYIRKNAAGRVVSLGKVRKVAKEAAKARGVAEGVQIQIPQLRKVGIIAARNDNGLIRIGWSQCDESSGDKFSLETALLWARSRMLEPKDVPPHLVKSVEAMKIRAKKYFKNCIPSWEGTVTGVVAIKKGAGGSRRKFNRDIAEAIEGIIRNESKSMRATPVA